MAAKKRRVTVKKYIPRKKKGNGSIMQFVAIFIILAVVALAVFAYKNYF